MLGPVDLEILLLSLGTGSGTSRAVVSDLANAVAVGGKVHLKSLY
jgi:hypothetical protein